MLKDQNTEERIFGDILLAGNFFLDNLWPLVLIGWGGGGFDKEFIEQIRIVRNRNNSSV